MYEEKKTSGLAIASLVCGIASLIINPCYLVSLAAIVLGIIGLSLRCGGKGMALAGLLVGSGSIVIWVIIDTIATIVSGGLGFFSYFI